MQTIKREQFPTFEQMGKKEFWTFLIKKSPNGKMGLWFVMINMPCLGNIFMVLNPVWRKIGTNGLPKNLGYYEQNLIEGDLKLLGLENAGPNEMLYILKVRELGFVPSTVHWVPPNNQEHFFSFLLRIRGNS